MTAAERTVPAGPPAPGAAGGGRRPSVLVPYIYLSSFVNRDIETLRARYDVVLMPCVPTIRIADAMAAMRRVDWLFCWFGSIRFLPLVLLARALGKPVIVVVGGYDVANLPELHYGNMRPGLTRVLTRALLRRADAIACVSQSAMAQTREAISLPPERLRLIYHGFEFDAADARAWLGDKEPIALTVGHCDEMTLHRKGLLAVAQVSRLLPDVRFVVAGDGHSAAMAKLREAAGPNVSFLGYVKYQALQTYYQRAKVYLQPSLHESFGCSVAEAMLFNCIPVVTNRYALPEVVGDTGYYVEPGDLPGLAARIREALAAPPPGGETPRMRVMREFPAGRRRDALLQLVEETVHA